MDVLTPAVHEWSLTWRRGGAPRPRIGEALDSIRREDEVKIEPAVLEQDDILAPEDLRGLGTRNREES